MFIFTRLGWVKLSHVDRFWPIQEMTVSVWGVLWVPGSFLACSLIGLPEGRALMTPSPLIEIVFHEIRIDCSKPPKDRHAIDHSFWHSFVVFNVILYLYLFGWGCLFFYCARQRASDLSPRLPRLPPPCSSLRMRLVPWHGPRRRRGNLRSTGTFLQIWSTKPKM